MKLTEEDRRQYHTAIYTAAMAFQDAAYDVDGRFPNLPKDIRKYLIREAGFENLKAAADRLSDGDAAERRQSQILIRAINL